MSIGDAIRYFDEMRKGKIKAKATEAIVDVLNKTLWDKVYWKSFHTYKVESIAQMINHIKSGTIPGTQNLYSKTYMRWKKDSGRYAHELTGEMKKSTYVEIHAGKVLFFIPSSATTRTNVYFTKAWTYNFGPIHEKRRSVIKSTVALAWKEIMQEVFKVYEENAKR